MHWSPIDVTRCSSSALHNVQALDIGYDADQLLFAGVRFADGAAPPAPAVASAMRDVATRLRWRAGVQAVATGAMDPMRGFTVLQFYTGRDSAGSFGPNEPTLGIVSPDGRDGMLEHARQFAEAGIPFVFDPGQGLPMFNGEELLACLQLADYCTVNDYEARLLCERTGRTIESLADEVKALIVTRGGEGSEIHTDGRKIDIPCAAAGRLAELRRVDR